MNNLKHIRYRMKFIANYQTKLNKKDKAKKRQLE